MRTSTPTGVRSWLVLAAFALALAGCGGSADVRPHPHVKVGAPYTINGIRYRPRVVSWYDEVGIASWYGEPFHGRLTANGEIFDQDAYTAAHPTLPLPGLVEVTNLDTGRRMVLRLNDRGPFAKGRLIDLSRAAARELGFERAGLARVRVVYLGPADLDDAIVALGEPPRRWEVLLAGNTTCRHERTQLC